VETARANARTRDLNLGSIVCYALAGVAGATWAYLELSRGTEVSVSLAGEGLRAVTLRRHF
jgi:hypothetical protein